MIKQLRRKFIMIAIASVAAVLVVLLGSINIANYLDVCNKADERLELLAEAGGSFEGFRQEPDMSGERPQIPENLGAVPPAPGMQSTHSAADDLDDEFDQEESDGLSQQGFADYDADDLDELVDGFAPFEFPDDLDKRIKMANSPELAYEMRYFSVSLDNNNVPVRANLSAIAAVDAQEAIAMAAQVVAKNTSEETSGFLGNYRYGLSEQDSGKLVLFLDCTRDLENFKSFALASVVAGLLGLALVAGLLIPLSRWVMRPVEENQERQRRFVTDASHELKTPLAIISSSLDVMELENTSNEWTDSIRNQVGRLSDLTEKLVTLSRTDEGAAALRVSNFDLTATAESLVEDFKPAALACNKQLIAQITQGLSYHGDQAMVGQAISLLLDNAIKHSASTEQNTGIVFEVSRAEGLGKTRQIIVRTTNAIEKGSLSAGDHPELFDRFSRADESRSQTGGHGIGLAVVRAIVEAHSGTVSTWVNDSQDSISITLKL